ncbi:uncharacterized protein LOC130727698 [Lotus japonicus]|uniref:uncharacterized protein LOC130727698 n=1 Tax=Lotus japonicus TaxID=34305 RepID=UPI002590014A|nr:uncharacterized protein LOC130727698 [Lotus japonicus]
MELKTLCCALPSQPLRSQTIGIHSPFKYQRQRFGFGNSSKCLKWVIKEPSLFGLSKFQRPIVHASESSVNGSLEVHPGESSSVPVVDVNGGLEVLPSRSSGVPVDAYNGVEPFRGKSGSVSFCGLTHQLVEEGKLESAPFNEEESSYFWLLGPAAFLSCLILPQFFVGNVVEAFFNDMILVDIVSSFTFEALFYIGLATFLHVVDRVQKPYLQFSSKRWGLITGLRGYLSSAFLTMGLKVVVPLLLLYAAWSVARLAVIVAVAPFLAGCVIQFAFEKYLDKRGSACWPLVPIIFEVYRLYQLTKAAHFVERLMFSLKGLPATPEILERSGALFAMIVSFQVLGIVCLWSLMTFLVRLFPSRPVADHY